MYNEEERTIPQMCEDVRTGKMSRRNFIKTLTAMGISVAGIAAITASDSANQHSPHKIEMKPEHQLHLHQQHLANQTQGNINTLQNDYAEHAVVEDSMYAQPFVGRQAIMARKRTGLGAIPDLKIHVTNRVVHGNQVTVEWIATGTHTGDFPGFPATGRFFTIPGVTVVIRHEEKIVRESIYYNMDDVRLQLGTSS